MCEPKILTVNCGDYMIIKKRKITIITKQSAFHTIKTNKKNQSINRLEAVYFKSKEKCKKKKKFTQEILIHRGKKHDILQDEVILKPNPIKHTNK